MKTQRHPTDRGSAKRKSQPCIMLVLQNIQKTTVKDQLNNIIQLGETHFRHVLKSIEQHHNLERPHQGIENVIPIQFDYPDKPARLEEVGCKSSLGGMLNHYYIKNKAA